MAQNDKNSRKGVQVSCTIDAELHEGLENYRWDPKVRLTMTQLLAKALEEFAANHGVKRADPETGETVADGDTKTEDKAKSSKA